MKFGPVRRPLKSAFEKIWIRLKSKNESSKMARNSTYNILMYSHDTYGLGHIRRTMAIAAHLLGPRVNILILTGSPIAGRFSFPEQIDFVRIPGMIKKTNDEYLPLSIKINARHALDIRKNIITATAKTFQPHNLARVVRDQTNAS